LGTAQTLAALLETLLEMVQTLIIFLPETVQTLIVLLHGAL
jgi:hypothetical protein